MGHVPLGRAQQYSKRTIRATPPPLSVINGSPSETLPVKRYTNQYRLITVTDFLVLVSLRYYPRLVNKRNFKGWKQVLSSTEIRELTKKQHCIIKSLRHTLHKVPGQSRLWSFPICSFPGNLPSSLRHSFSFLTTFEPKPPHTKKNKTSYWLANYLSRLSLSPKLLTRLQVRNLVLTQPRRRSSQVCNFY
jgi:hypothetical protein